MLNLKILRRNIARNPGYTILNFTCLSLGIAATLLIILYLNFELNYDSHHKNVERIYRVETPKIQTQESLREVGWRGTNGLVGPYMKKDFPEVEAMARIFGFYHDQTIKLDNQGIVTQEEDIYAADAEILDIFSFNLIHGEKSTALTGPNKIIISENLSIRIFGKENPVGKNITTKLQHVLPNMPNEYALQVTGVYKDLPANSILNMKAILSAETDPNLKNYYFKRFSFFTYVLLKEGANTTTLTEKLPTIYEKYLDRTIEMTMKYAVHSLVPLKDIHMIATGGYSYIYIFGAIGFLLLLISVISYINVVTAQASKRTKEIGIRKVIGSTKRQLIIQFLSESMFFSFIAMLAALTITIVSVGYVNRLLELQLNLTQLLQPSVLFAILIILVFVGLIGGSYPAFFLSSFKPVGMMKGKLSTGAPMRKALVAVQFSVVVFILASTGMVYEQLKYMRQKDLGFNSKQIIRLALPADETPEKVTLFKESLLTNPKIDNIGTSSFIPGVAMGRRPISADGGKDKSSQFVHFGMIDYDYLSTMDIDIAEGRNFSIDHPADAENKILVNKAFTESFGLENPVGERVRYGDKGNPNFITIVGVVEDFHQNSLHDPIAAQMFLLEPNAYNLFVKISNDLSTGLTRMEKSWIKIFPNTPFEYHFLDQDIQAAYEVDQIRGKLFLIFSLLTIFIAFLGLFGLAAFNTSQRVKEIGIRKVLGASSWSILFLIGKDFLKIVLIAAIPAFIAAWFFINNWLQDFAYRTDMNYALFLMALLFTLGITFITTSLHACRAAATNPAQTLKSQ